MPGSASYCSSLPPLSLLVAAGSEATGHFFPAVANTGATTRPAQLGLQVLCLYLHCSGSVRPLSRCCFLFRRHPNRSSTAGRALTAVASIARGLSASHALEQDTVEFPPPSPVAFPAVAISLSLARSGLQAKGLGFWVSRGAENGDDEKGGRGVGVLGFTSPSNTLPPFLVSSFLFLYFICHNYC